MERIEKKLLDKKSWDMRGEILGTQREKETLLNNEMQYDEGLKGDI